VVVGAQTDACIRSTLHGAFVRGYDATLVSDAHTTADQTEWGAPAPDQVIAHTNLYWSYETAPGRTAGTVETKDVDFADVRADAKHSGRRPKSSGTTNALLCGVSPARLSRLILTETARARRRPLGG
jgi:hypothetical protein